MQTSEFFATSHVKCLWTRPFFQMAFFCSVDKKTREQLRMCICSSGVTKKLTYSRKQKMFGKHKHTQTQSQSRTVAMRIKRINICQWYTLDCSFRAVICGKLRCIHLNKHKQTHTQKHTHTEGKWKIRKPQRKIVYIYSAISVRMVKVNFNSNFPLRHFHFTGNSTF